MNGYIWSKDAHRSKQEEVDGAYWERNMLALAYTQNDMFKPVRLRFQSREGLTWHTLGYLEDYLLVSVDSVPQIMVLFVRSLAIFPVKSVDSMVVAFCIELPPIT